MGADVLLRDARGDVLLVDPSYKPDWDLPGGMAEANEPPHLAAERELREELGLEVRVGPLLVVDWLAPHGPWDDSLMFVFDGGVVSSPGELRPTDDELIDCRFVSLEHARALLRPYVWHRLWHAVDAARTGRPRYLSNGQG